MAEQKCAACGSAEGKDESGLYAMIKMTGRDKIQINLDSSTMVVMTVKARTCGNCRFVSLFDVP